MPVGIGWLGSKRPVMPGTSGHHAFSPFPLSKIRSKEQRMHYEGTIELEEPQLTDEGIAFVVRVEHSGRACLVTREAL